MFIWLFSEINLVAEYSQAVYVKTQVYRMEELVWFIYKKQILLFYKMVRVVLKTNCFNSTHACIL